MFRNCMHELTIAEGGRFSANSLANETTASLIYKRPRRIKWPGSAPLRQRNANHCLMAKEPIKEVLTELALKLRQHKKHVLWLLVYTGWFRSDFPLSIIATGGLKSIQTDQAATGPSCWPIALFYSHRLRSIFPPQLIFFVRYLAVRVEMRESTIEKLTVWSEGFRAVRTRWNRRGLFSVAVTFFSSFEPIEPIWKTGPRTYLYAEEWTTAHT